jgi:hypothetical protein
LGNLVLSGSTSGSITISPPSSAGSNTLTLPANTGTVITTGSTFAGTGPAFSAYQSVQQTGIASATWTKITLTTENFDTNSNFASSRFTPTIAGYYQCNGSVQLTGANTAYYVAGAFYKNGASYAQFNLANGNANYYPQSTGSSVIYLNGTTDYVEVYAFGSASGSWSAYNTKEGTYFNACLVRSE